MSNLIDDLVPKGPPDLCFESSAFTKEVFSVDEFLQEHRTGGNLETMRDDLGVYLKVLRSAMIDLINKDYADYVNLSSNLIGLDKAIGNINAPLGQLREELLQVNQYINNAMCQVTQKLEQRKALRERKRSLRALSRVRYLLRKLQMLLSSAVQDRGELVERAVNEFTQLELNADRCFHLMSQQEKQEYEEVGEVVYRDINRLLIDSIKAKESGREQLSHCLAYYLNINRHHHLERFYRQSVVGPALEPLITKESLRSLPRGLPALYEKILYYIDNDMKHLIDLTNNNTRYPGLSAYDFLLRSFWPEVEQRLEMNLSSIYDAGDPNTFYTRYSETLVFLEEMGKRFIREESRSIWQSQDNFACFINKWNIAVYFQIRFQEIVKGVEVTLGRENVTAAEGSTWKLESTASLWQSLLKCWAPGIFILAIADKFWKLTLQILARYHTFIKHTISQKVGLLKGENGGSSKLLVYLYWDVEMLVSRLVELRDIAFSNMPNISSSTRQSLTKSLEESGRSLSSELVSVEQAIVSCLCSKCCLYLRQVSDIPRLYRRTNREPPTKPCPYITSLLEPPQQFSNLHSNLSSTKLWLQTVFSELTKQYYKLVSEVLTSVQKTEESLRRLKKARDNRNQALPPQQQRTADDDKIRLQLLIDVTAYATGIDELGIKRSSVEQLTELLLLVETTHKL